MARRKSSEETTRRTIKKVKSTLSRSCGCLQAHFGLLDRYPEFRANQVKIEQFTKYCKQAGARAFRSGVMSIPVVVHVIHRTAAEKISVSQVKSQIASLNKDFRAKNPDRSKTPAAFKSLVTDARIEFKLATKDPDGKKTTGITYTNTSQSSFSHIDDDMKFKGLGGADAWDTSRFLNIWICTLGGGLLGYAQFPGGPPDTDGVVIRNTAFGTQGTATAPFNKGRTATHEVGHFLNLSHIWGEGRISTCSDSDFVDDTPNQFDKHYGTPMFPQISCTNGPDGDMFMNYMDYVDDAAMFMFTCEQVARMKATLAGPRNTLGR